MQYAPCFNGLVAAAPLVDGLGRRPKTDSSDILIDLQYEMVHGITYQRRGDSSLIASRHVIPVFDIILAGGMKRLPQSDQRGEVSNCDDLIGTPDLSIRSLRLTRSVTGPIAADPRRACKREMGAYFMGTT